MKKRGIFFQRFVLSCALCAVVPVQAFAQMLTGYPDVRTMNAEPHITLPTQATAVSTPTPISTPISANDLLKAEPTPTNPEPSQPSPVSESVIQDDKPKEAPIDFQADQLDYDEDTKIVTARGNVFLTQEGRILRADTIIYDMKQDTVEAQGHVVLSEPDGDIHSADNLVLSNKFKDGVVRYLTTVLQDGSRLTAKTGHRVDGEKTVMRTATYTACKPCEANPDAPPAWEIKASKVTHYKEEHRIAYQNARFETYGVPVMYFPYFSHPDGTLDRKTGFLTPTAAYQSNEGFMLDNRYYIDIAPDQDATIGLRAFTNEDPLLLAQWRKRWDESRLELNVGTTYTDYETYDYEGNITQHDEDFRGHVAADFLTNLNDKWRAGANINWVSDDVYLDQYDISGSNVLTSDLYLERFSGRNYAASHLITFQDLRVLEDPVDQPEIAPELTLNMEGDPGAVPVIGGNWYVGSSYLGLRRSGDDEQDMDRISVETGWKRHFISDYGLVSNVTLSTRQDLYHVRDREVATQGSGLSTEASDVRFFPQAHWVSSYPLVKQGEFSQTKIEPIMAITAAPNMDTEDAIPNEDSQDVQLDVDNLFNANRFPGIDRVEDQSRITYGVKSGLYFGQLGSLETFLGQSYRLDTQPSPFLRGSGLDQRSSDVVGSIEGTYKQHRLDYRFQLDSRQLYSNRHEVDAELNFGRYVLSSGYLFSKALEGTDLTTSREQVSADMAYYLNDNWRASIGAVQDFGEYEGLRKAYFDLTHFGQCVSWGVRTERSYTQEATGDSDLEISLRLGLKNIGDFERPAWQSTHGDE